MYNKETVIRLNTLDDVQEFVGAASKCDFDIDLKYRQILIDAKSLLGVIGIGTNNDFKVCYMGDDQAFDNVVDISSKDERVIKYLKGETIEACGKDGWALICVDSYPLGWGKLNNGTLKNKYLTGWRLMS